jgi:hypothetical protein
VVKGGVQTIKDNGQLIFLDASRAAGGPSGNLNLTSMELGETARVHINMHLCHVTKTQDDVVHLFWEALLVAMSGGFVYRILQ